MAVMLLALALATSPKGAAPELVDVTTLEPRWQKPEQLHITLKFLGYVEAERLPELEQTLSAEAHASHPIKTCWAGLHAFASPSRARVVIARLSDPRAELLALYTRLEASLSSLGFPLEERAFTPHVTIARLEAAGDVRSWLSLSLPEMKFDLGCLRLYRSERPLAFFTIFGTACAAAAIVLAVPIVVTYFETGLVPRFPTAILSTGLMLTAFLAVACGFILDTVTRGRREMKLLAYLAQRGPR